MRNPFLEISRKTRVKAYDIEELVVDRTEMEEIPKGSLSSFPNLQSLYVPYNKLTKLENLENNTRLRTIDARGNKITDVNLSKQQFIVDLLLSDNNLMDLDVFCTRIAHLKDLDTLDLRGNEVSQEKGYRNRIISMFPRLKILDGIEVTPSERVKNTRLVKPGTIERSKTRCSSVAEYLKAQPKSAADAFVSQKANAIRRAHEKQRLQREAEQTAASRERKESFDALVNSKEIPIPEALDFLGMSLRSQENKQQESAAIKRPNTRMFLKTLKYRELSITRPEEELLCQMNPRMTPKAIKTIVEPEIVYPTFTDC